MGEVSWRINRTSKFQDNRVGGMGSGVVVGSVSRVNTKGSDIAKK